MIYEHILRKRDGKLERIEEKGFPHVGIVKNLPQLGAIFGCSSYVRMMEYNLNIYLQIYREIFFTIKKEGGSDC